MNKGIKGLSIHRLDGWMGELMDKQINGWMAGLMEEHFGMYRHMDWWMNYNRHLKGWMSRWVHWLTNKWLIGQTDKWMDGWITDGWKDR